MGIQDRDYMHERRNPFTPPKAKPTSALTIILVIVVGMWLLYRGYGWLLNRGIPDRIAQQAGHLVKAPQAGDPTAVQVAPPRWTRCIVNGQVLYSETNCPDNTPTTRPVEPATRNPRPATDNGVITLYHCKAYNGGTFWANAHCNQHKALVDRMVSVPSTLPFEQQVQIAETRRSAGTTTTASRTVIINKTGASSKTAQCEALNEQIVQHDAMARQPLSAQVQDRIREMRKLARDRQFALRC